MRLPRRRVVTKKRMIVVVLLLTTVVAILCAVFWVNKHPAEIQRHNDVIPAITNSTDTPDEQPITTSNYSWRGLGSEPKRLSFPTIATEGYLQKVGIDQHQQIAVPNNIHLAGWFDESVKPGEQGLSIIDGHVDGRQTGGIFRHLVELKIGDKFQIERGDGKILSYTVLSVSKIDLDKAHDALFSQDSKVKSQLNLITCGGEFNDQTKSYNQRVIVTASLD